MRRESIRKNVWPNIDAGEFTYPDAKTIWTDWPSMVRRMLSTSGHGGGRGMRVGSISSVFASQEYRAGKRQKAGASATLSNSPSSVASISAAGSVFPEGARKKRGSSTRLRDPAIPVR